MRRYNAKENPILPILLGIAGLAALGGTAYYFASRNSSGGGGGGGGGPQEIGPKLPTNVNAATINAAATEAQVSPTVAAEDLAGALSTTSTTQSAIQQTAPAEVTALTPPAGGYQQTCTNINYDASGELAATCKTKSGSEQLTSVFVPNGYTGPIDNVNGQLELT